jgi:hypothetical protein
MFRRDFCRKLKTPRSATPEIYFVHGTIRDLRCRRKMSARKCVRAQVQSATPQQNADARARFGHGAGMRMA